MKTLTSIAAFGAREWDRLSPPSFPFSDFDYLSALETSGCVGADAGWVPCHLSAGDGAAPLYLKDNSYGEYIFDWAWARAYHEAKIPYYPKLVSAIPFTPATGPKLLGGNRGALAAAALNLARDTQVSSLHFLFIPPEELPLFEQAGFFLRHSFQFHWKNRGYRDFADFLDAMKSRKRKSIQHERSEIEKAGLSIRMVTGDALTDEHARAMHAFYLSTIFKMGAIAYLTEDFFLTVFRTMRDRIVLFLATREGDPQPVAGAINFRKGDCLYGRYWGCHDDFRHLHFELCYYRAIEYAIGNGIRLFEAGAQGEHKLARGFLPELTYSAHWIAHPAFSEAIGRFIGEEKRALEGLVAELTAQSPFRSAS